MDALNPSGPEHRSAWHSPCAIRFAILAGIFALGFQAGLFFIHKGLFLLALPLVIPAYILCFLDRGLARTALITLSAGCFGIFLLTANHHLYQATWNTPSREVRQHLHAIQLGLELYARDHGGYYPVRVEDVISQGYLAAWPDNPYFFDSSVLMQSLPVDNAPFTGNFMYLPQFETVDGVRVCTGYELHGYGECTRQTWQPAGSATYSLSSGG